MVAACLSVVVASLGVQPTRVGDRRRGRNASTRDNDIGDKARQTHVRSFPYKPSGGNERYDALTVNVWNGWKAAVRREPVAATLD
jgi:hypothetical protein